MKTTFKCLVTFFMAALLPTFAFAEPESYTMVCQGGPDMRMMINHDVDGSGVPGATAMAIFFRGGASPDNPSPGECVWQDRILNAAEPTSLWIKSPRIEFSIQAMGDGRIATDGSGMRLNVEGAHASVEAKDWQHLVNGVMRGETFKVKVYNDGGRVMAITEILRPR